MQSKYVLFLVFSFCFSSIINSSSPQYVVTTLSKEELLKSKHLKGFIDTTKILDRAGKTLTFQEFETFFLEQLNSYYSKPVSSDNTDDSMKYFMSHNYPYEIAYMFIKSCWPISLSDKERQSISDKCCKSTSTIYDDEDEIFNDKEKIKEMRLDRFYLQSLFHDLETENLGAKYLELQNKHEELRRALRNKKALQQQQNENN